MAKFNSIREVTDALARGEINASEANEHLVKLTQATLRIETGPKGTGVVKMAGRSFPLASLYRDQWEVLLDPDNVAKILEYVQNPSNRVKASK